MTWDDEPLESFAPMLKNLLHRGLGLLFDRLSRWDEAFIPMRLK